jgi:hypothetical protein
MLNKLMMADGLPSEETFLVNETSISAGLLQITIPKGVSVVKTYIKNTYSDWTGDGSSGSSVLYTHDGRKVWLNGPESGSCTVYVGVSENKTYSLCFYCVNIDIQKFTISYSASINRQTPTVTDY